MQPPPQLCQGSSFLQIPLGCEARPQHGSLQRPVFSVCGRHLLSVVLRIGTGKVAWHRQTFQLWYSLCLHYTSKMLQPAPVPRPSNNVSAKPSLRWFWRLIIYLAYRDAKIYLVHINIKPKPDGWPPTRNNFTLGHLNSLLHTQLTPGLLGLLQVMQCSGKTRNGETTARCPLTSVSPGSGICCLADRLCSGVGFQVPSLYLPPFR